MRSTFSTPLEQGNLLDERQVASILSVSVSTLRNWRWRGEGPAFIKVGSRLVRYRPDDLQAFVNDGREGG